MIVLSEEDLHRLRQLRDDLVWLGNIVETQHMKNLPYRHYLVQIRSTSQVVGSLVRNTEAVAA